MDVSALKSQNVRPNRLYEQVAGQIEALIRDQQLRAGAKLPSERELSKQLGVGRPSLREAMIAMETLGLVDFRVGEGTFIATELPPNAGVSIVADADLGPGPNEQFEARRVIEVVCAGLAARRATPRQIDEMEECVDAMVAQISASIDPAHAHRQFHELLAAASGNKIFVKAVRDLWDLRGQSMWGLLRQKAEHVESWGAGLSFRRRLIECLRLRDEAGARAETEAYFDRARIMYFG